MTLSHLVFALYFCNWNEHLFFLTAINAISLWCRFTEAVETRDAKVKANKDNAFDSSGRLTSETVQLLRLPDVSEFLQNLWVGQRDADGVFVWRSSQIKFLKLHIVLLSGFKLI